MNTKFAVPPIFVSWIFEFQKPKPGIQDHFQDLIFCLLIPGGAKELTAKTSAMADSGDIDNSSGNTTPTSPVAMVLEDDPMQRSLYRTADNLNNTEDRLSGMHHLDHFTHSSG